MSPRSRIGIAFSSGNLKKIALDWIESICLVIDDLSTGRMENLAGLDVRFLKGSLTDLLLLKEAFAGVACVFLSGGYSLG
ncbi:MAG: hypothetical protein ACYDHX_12535 [Methanothrix sp.]